MAELKTDDPEINGARGRYIHERYTRGSPRLWKYTMGAPSDPTHMSACRSQERIPLTRAPATSEFDPKIDPMARRRAKVRNRIVIEALSITGTVAKEANLRSVLERIIPNHAGHRRRCTVCTDKRSTQIPRRSGSDTVAERSPRDRGLATLAPAGRQVKSGDPTAVPRQPGGSDRAS